MTGAELINYLSWHDLNEEVRFLVANPEDRLVYSIKEAECVLDEESSIPGLYIEIDEAIDLTERRAPKPKFRLFK